MDEDLEDTVVSPTRPPRWGGTDGSAPSTTDELDYANTIPRLEVQALVAEAMRDTQPIVVEPEPEFFAFRIAGVVVTLDKVAYVGRRPSSPRIFYGQMPRLVRVPSAEREVSGTHLEVRQLGASVVITDMHSTNGSLVMTPIGGARKLTQGESVVVPTGTLVDIGDGNIVEILPMQPREGLGGGADRIEEGP